MECADTVAAQAKLFESFVRATPAVCKPGRNLIIRRCPCELISCDNTGTTSLVLTNDSIIIVSLDKGKILGEVELSDCFIDALLPNCHKFVLGRLEPPHTSYKIRLNNIADKFLFTEDISRSIIGAAPPEAQLDLGWAHLRVRGSLHAVALSGNVARANGLCKFIAGGSAAEIDSDEDEIPAGIDAQEFRAAAFTDTSLDCNSCAGADTDSAVDVDIDAVDDSGCTPLHYGVHSGSAVLVGVLVQHGASMSSMDSDCNTPLHLAAQSGAISVAAVLLANGAPPNARNLLECTPLHLALSGCTVPASLPSLVELLINNGSDPGEPDGEGLTPFHHLAMHQRASVNPSRIALALCKCGADANVRAPLRAATGPNRSNADDSVTPLHLACGLRYLGDNRPMLEECGDAFCRIDLRVIAALLSAGAGPNMRTGVAQATPLHLVLRCMASVRAAAASGSNVTISPDAVAAAGGMHPLAALSYDLLAAAHTLVAHGARLDIADGTGSCCCDHALALGCLNALEASAASFEARAPPTDAGEHITGLRLEQAFLLRLDGKLGGRSENSAKPAPEAKPGTGLGGFMSRLKASASTSASSPCTGCGTGYRKGSEEACTWCHGRVCGACSRKRFPSPRDNAVSRAVPVSIRGSSKVDSDDDDEEEVDELAIMAAAAKQKLSSIANAVSVAFRAPAAGKASSTAKYGPVCDSCFNLLCTLCKDRSHARKQFEQQAAAQAVTARNMQEKPLTKAAAGSTAMLSKSKSLQAPSSAPSGNADADRQALFGSRNSAGASAGKAASGSALGSGAMAQSNARRTGDLQSVMEGNKDKLAQRGERLSRLAMVTGDMANDAAEFESAAKKLKAKYQSPLGWFGM